jgi:hypothetical protein
MFGSASSSYGAAPAPASHGAPPPAAAASYGSHGASAPYVDPFGASPPPLGGSAPAANVASGLFLGLAGDGGSSSSGSNAMGASSAMGASYGIRKAPPRAHAGSSSAGVSSTFSDPFASVPSGSGHAVVDPFAPQPQPQQYSMDPFGSVALPPLSGASTAVPNDPFSFTRPPLAASFQSNFGSGTSSTKQDDDPFADLVASGQR